MNTRQALKVVVLATAVMVGFGGLTLADPWPGAAARAYIERCTAEMSAQGMPQKVAGQYCTCFATGLEDEFGFEEYRAMMQAQPDPAGSVNDQRLYGVIKGCEPVLAQISVAGRTGIAADNRLFLETGFLALMFAFAIAIVAYAPFAESRGWPVGAWFADYTSFPMILAGVTMIAAPVAGIVLLPWWTSLVIMAGGFIVGLAITRAFRRNVQTVALVGLFGCWFVAAVTSF